MTFASTTPETVGKTLCNTFDAWIGIHRNNEDWEEFRDHLFSWFEPIDQQLGFAGMLWVLEHSELYQHHLLAGELLTRAHTPAFLSLRDLLVRITPRVNASAETVPLYLAQQFGTEPVLESLRELRGETIDERTRCGIDAFLYYLGNRVKQ